WPHRRRRRPGRSPAAPGPHRPKHRPRHRRRSRPMPGPRPRPRRRQWPRPRASPRPPRRRPPHARPPATADRHPPPRPRARRPFRAAHVAPIHPIPPAIRNTRNHETAVKLEKKIPGDAVVTPEDKEKTVAGASVPREKAEAELPKTADVIQMHERIGRPEVLIGSTYKIKSPLVEHAMYVTIND